MPKMNSSTPSYSFHGSNSSHSKDSGQGGRTYHVPNYATRTTSYANEKSHLISVTFDEDKGAKKTIIAIVFMFLLLLGYSACAFMGGSEKSSSTFRPPGALGHQEQVEPPAPVGEEVRSSATGSTGNAGFDGQWVDSGVDELVLGTVPGISDGAPATGLYWDELQGGTHCIAYGARRYTARLRNVPILANRTQACMETAVQINGFNFKSPDECEVSWLFGAVRGYWNVTFRENECTPVWGKITDQGCVKKSPHKRLFRARLWNIKKGEDQLMLCRTAPAHIAGIYRSVPDTCENHAIWGTYGSWTLEDMKC